MLNGDEYLPDGSVIEGMRHQFIGNYKGLTHLGKVLENRKAELLARIKKQQNQNNERE